MTKDEALKMAIEALAEFEWIKDSKYQKAINACKEALEQPAQEPVAWIDVKDKLPKQLDIVLVSGKHKSEKSRSGNYELVDTATYYDWTWEKNGTKGWLSPRFGSDYDEVTHWMPLPKYPLYTHPHQWQGLTDDEIVKAFNLCDWMNEPITEFARAIEQALKEKNCGI
jgi:hypothetical protein